MYILKSAQIKYIQHKPSDQVDTEHYEQTQKYPWPLS